MLILGLGQGKHNMSLEHQKIRRLKKKGKEKKKGHKGQPGKVASYQSWNSMSNKTYNNNITLY